MAVSNDGKCILASCLDSKVRLLETDTGELLNTYSGHHAASMRAEGRLSHDDACVLSTSEDGRVVVWDIVQAMMVRQFQVSLLLLSHSHECCCAHATSLPAQTIIQPLVAQLYDTLMITWTCVGIFNSSHIHGLPSSRQVRSQHAITSSALNHRHSPTATL